VEKAVPAMFRDTYADSQTTSWRRRSGRGAAGSRERRLLFENQRKRLAHAPSKTTFSRLYFYYPHTVPRMIDRNECAA